MLAAFLWTVRPPTYQDAQGEKDEEQTSVAHKLYIYLIVYHSILTTLTMLRSEYVSAWFGKYFSVLKFMLKNPISRDFDIFLMLMTTITVILLCQRQIYA